MGDEKKATAPDVMEEVGKLLSQIEDNMEWLTPDQYAEAMATVKDAADVAVGVMEKARDAKAKSILDRVGYAGPLERIVLPEPEASEWGTQENSKMSKPIVYIASPHTKGDPCMNTHFQCKVFNQMMDDGLVWPFIPLLTHFQHTVFPRHHQDWIDYDLALLDRFDACVRLSSSFPELDYNVSESSGADGEVERFLELDKPVFYSIDDCYGWVRGLPTT